MALPKKGIRKITVDGIKYYFTVQLEYYMMTIQVAIGLYDNPNKRFYFSVKQYDPFLKIETNDELKIGSITPKLVSKAIKFANSNSNWTENNKSVHIRFSNNELSFLRENS